MANYLFIFPSFRTFHLRTSRSSSPWLMLINIIHTHSDVIIFTISSPKHVSNDLDCQGKKHSNDTWMNWMVMADFPTPPPPTTTILYLFWFILCSLITSLALLLGHLQGHLLDRLLGYHLDHLLCYEEQPSLQVCCSWQLLVRRRSKVGRSSSRVRAAAATWAAFEQVACERHLYFTHTTHGQGAAQYCLRDTAPSLGKFQSRNIVLRGRVSAATNCLVIHRIKTVQSRCSNISRDYLLVQRSISREFRIGTCLVNWTSECWGSFPLILWCLWNDCNGKRNI